MRDIEFRGKRVDNGEWVYGNLVMVRDAEKCKQHPEIVISYNLDTYDWHEVIPETVGQFAGTFDGNDFYDGDILKGLRKEQGKKKGGYEIKDVLRFQTGGFEVFSKPLQNFYALPKLHVMWCDSGWNGRKDYYYEIINIEVLGNIHDTPELLTPQ